MKSITNNSLLRVLVNILLVSNAFVWYFFAITILIDIVGLNQFDSGTSLCIWVLHFAGIILSALVGASFGNRIKNRRTFLIAWMLLGVCASLSLFLVNLTVLQNVLALSLILGVSLGVGMPCCMGYFTETIEIEKRGRVGGIILLFSGLAMAVLGSISSGNLILEIVMLVAWRLVGLLAFAFTNTNSIVPPKLKNSSYRFMLTERSFILYFIPWIMFSLITYLTIPLQTEIIGASTIDFLKIVENGLTGVFALCGGFLVDRLGRKRIAIVGFASLGLSYSVLGIFPRAIESWYFYTVVDGIAWGMLYVLFVVTIWGDLSYSRHSDKYYALGVMPFFVSKFSQLTVGNSIISAMPQGTREYAIFSFTAFFLFIAVLPLVYAPETLPEKILQHRDLKTYVEKAQKKAAKEAEKKQKSDSSPDQSPSEEDEDEEIKRAEQLAEQYY